MTTFTFQDAMKLIKSDDSFMVARDKWGPGEVVHGAGEDYVDPVAVYIQVEVAGDLVITHPDRGAELYHPTDEDILADDWYII